MKARYAALLLLLLVIGCNGGSTGPGNPLPNPIPPPPPPTEEVDPVVEELLLLHNQERGAVGKGKLHLDDRCLVAARKHARWMAENNRHSHRGEDGSTVGDRLSDAGYRWTLVGENIAWGYPSPSAVTSGWLGSAGHRANILNNGYESVGFGYADGGRGRYWCAVFGRESGQRSLSEPGNPWPGQSMPGPLVAPGLAEEPVIVAGFEMVSDGHSNYYFKGTNVRAMWLEVGNSKILADTTQQVGDVEWMYNPIRKEWEIYEPGPEIDGGPSPD